MTSRNAVVAASCAVSLAIVVLRRTCTARYQSEIITPSELMSCAVALIASQFTTERLLHDFADENVQLPVRLLADLRDFVRPGCISRDR